MNSIPEKNLANYGGRGTPYFRFEEDDLPYQESLVNTAPASRYVGSRAASLTGAGFKLHSESGYSKIEVTWSDATSLTGEERNEIVPESTSEKPWSDRAEYELEILFDAAKEEIFEDGVETDFSRQLINSVRNFGGDAMSVISHLIIYEKISSEVASEALRWLGILNNAATYTHRRWLLESALNCSSSRVRDGAALGLSYLHDRHALPYLRGAIQREQCKELRHDMTQVLQQLEDHVNALTAENSES